MYKCGALLELLSPSTMSFRFWYLQHDVENGPHKQCTASRALQRYRMMKKRNIDLANLTYVHSMEQAPCFCDPVFNAGCLALKITLRLGLVCLPPSERTSIGAQVTVQSQTKDMFRPKKTTTEQIGTE
jgi:hypothetical protein